MSTETPIRPTVASVTVVLATAGWSPYEQGRDGFKVRPLDGGVICVEYETSPWRSISHDANLAAMARVLRADVGWFVTEAGRVLVSAARLPAP